MANLSRQFASASSQRGDFASGLFNWEYTQAWTFAGWMNLTSNTSGALWCKQQNAGNFTGLYITYGNGTSTPRISCGVQNTGAAGVNRAMSTDIGSGWHHVVVTYDGSGTAAGCLLYVDGAQPATTTQNTLGGASVLTTVNAQIGCRGGSAAPGFFGNVQMRRWCWYTRVLTSGERALLDAGATAPDTIGNLYAWIEGGPLNIGNTLLAEWSGNGSTVILTNTPTTVTTGPSITALTPTLGSTGVKTLSGPLTRNPNNPIASNLGPTGGAPVGSGGDQISPQAQWVQPNGDVVGLFENVNGVKTLDVANQPGSFDFDTPSIWGQLVAGTWTFTAQDAASSAVININNIGASAGNKSTLRAETSVSHVFRDDVNSRYYAVFHGGNNSGGRKLYALTCPYSSDPSVAGNWTIFNSGTALLSLGTAGAFDDTSHADGKGCILPDGRWVLLYHGQNSTGVPAVGAATSSNQGGTWTKVQTTAVIAAGAAGTWNAGGMYSGAVFYDRGIGKLVVWCGGGRTAGNPEGLGFYSADTSDLTTWTAGAYNPVLEGAGAASPYYEALVGVVVGGYFTGSTYKIGYFVDDAVSGTAGHRDLAEATISQIVVPSSSHIFFRAKPKGGAFRLRA